MVKKRRRFRQTTSLAERLAEEAARLRERARNLPPGVEQTLLWRKVRQAETALRIEAWLGSPDAPTPDNVITMLSKSPKKRSLSKPSPST
ncbi:MAG TPA: hypothetical protein VNX23_15930 [Bradyrhizobium sp.]|jgi:hypothetical protein|uniref:hypothetical protein n=1 Tax=Bradyrhizobium sp. TaxID=376 RepID=UPI002D026FE6|nr:hypothetical protein [Bradyrhizobium sp.]HXB78863.1 hypothetical protein [Bradyrhizobium sp.]